MHIMSTSQYTTKRKMQGVQLNVEKLPHHKLQFAADREQGFKQFYWLPDPSIEYAHDGMHY